MVHEGGVEREKDSRGHGAPTWWPRIDPAGPVPLYEQVIEQVARAVVSGRLLPNDPLPSVRMLATELRINPNTAARAMRELDGAGLARAERGVGMRIHPRARVAAARIARRSLRRELEAMARVARELGLELPELLRELTNTWEEMEDAD